MYDCGKVKIGDWGQEMPKKGSKAKVYVCWLRSDWNRIKALQSVNMLYAIAFAFASAIYIGKDENSPMRASDHYNKGINGSPVDRKFDGFCDEMHAKGIGLSWLYYIPEGFQHRYFEMELLLQSGFTLLGALLKNVQISGNISYTLQGKYDTNYRLPMVYYWMVDALQHGTVYHTT